MALLMRATCNKYSLFINNYYSKLTIADSQLRPRINLFRHTVLINFCSDHNVPENTEKMKNPTDKINSFYTFIASRKREAKRSVIIQVQSPNSYQDLYSYCATFGTIKQIQSYTSSKGGHFFLIEFQEISSQQSLISSATHVNFNEIVPVTSSVLWFRNVPKKAVKISTQSIPPKLQNNTLAENQIMGTLTSLKSINDQINHLYTMSKLDDIGIRLRFLTALQLESIFTGLFPNVVVFPFGSSVNGFGRKNCDLDLILNFEPSQQEMETSRLVFHTKLAMSTEKAQTKRSMDIVATLMHSFLPGIYDVKRILQARVPLIKYYNSLTDVECDLTMTNVVALYMSELLYLFGESDDRVRPLVFTIRAWAANVGITNPNPGPWVTNFSLTLMVLFFLQSEGIIPELKKLQALALPTDVIVTENCSNCTFLRDLSKWPKGTSDVSLEKLLIKFFHFYANFDFSSKAISLNEVTSITKPDESALYIVNPLEKTLNVGKNVNESEIRRFVNATRNAALLLNDRRACGQGLLDLFVEKKPLSQHIFAKVNRKLDIANLFKGDLLEKGKDDSNVMNCINKKNFKSNEEKLNVVNSDVKVKQVRR